MEDELFVKRRGSRAKSMAKFNALLSEYEQYVQAQHQHCIECPSARCGPDVARALLAWKIEDRDGHLGRWTREDILGYLGAAVEQEIVDFGIPEDSPEFCEAIFVASDCVEDFIYFLSDRGSLTGDGKQVLLEAVREVQERLPEEAPALKGS